MSRCSTDVRKGKVCGGMGCTGSSHRTERLSCLRHREEGMMLGTKNEQIVAALSKGLTEPKISVVGCGGAGGNIINSIYWSNKNVETIAINTDENKLEKVDAHKKVLIGKDVTHGQGADGFPEVGECCAEKARSTIEGVLKGSDIVFIVAGMGGGTGTGAAPVVANVAKSLNAVTFAIAINPFSYENGRQEIAKAGIKKLREAAETTIVLDNDRLLQIAGDITINESFSIMERSINKLIDSVSSKISSDLINQIRTEVDEAMQENEAQMQVVHKQTVQLAPIAELVTASMSVKVPEISIAASMSTTELISR